MQHAAVMMRSDTARKSPGAFHAMTNSLDRLPDDVLIHILQASSVHAVLSLRKTSRRYYLLSKLRCVWYARFGTEVLARNLPLPGPPCSLSLLSAAELERRTLRALYLDQAWPNLSANTLVSSTHDVNKAGLVDQVVFILGGTELLTAQGDKVVHWLIVCWPGLAPQLKRIGEWTPLEGVPCRLVKDVYVPGVMAVGPREPSESHRFAKVFSTSLKAPFVNLCDYARVPGVVVGIWRHLLILDTTGEVGGGCLEVLDWHAQTTGTAILPCLPNLFGEFLDFVMFAGHLLVVLECCISVFPVPQVPVEGRVVVERIRVFLFQEEISRPIGFTACIAQRSKPQSVSSIVGRIERDVDWDPDGQRRNPSTSGMWPTLTIAARSRRHPNSVSMVMLIPLADEAKEYDKLLAVDPTTFLYRLAYRQSHSLVPWRPGNGTMANVDTDDSASPCTVLCLGSSGRGLYFFGQEARLVSAGVVFLPPYEMQIGPVFEAGTPLYLAEHQRAENLRVNARAGVDKVDFDEGMGRFVVVAECGFEVVQLD